MKKLVVALALTAFLTVAGTALSGGTARFYAQNTTRSLNKLNAALNPLFTRRGGYHWAVNRPAAIPTPT